MSKIEDAYRAWPQEELGPDTMTEDELLRAGFRAGWDAALAAGIEKCREYQTPTSSRDYETRAYHDGEDHAAGKLASALSSLRAGTTGGMK